MPSWVTINRWYHVVMLGHEQAVQRVFVPSWDRSSRGVLVNCQCGRSWLL